MTSNFFSQTLDSIEIDKAIVQKLNQHNIKQIKDLWGLKRKDLKALGLIDTEIKHITIKLQLQNIDLNKKIYHKN